MVQSRDQLCGQAGPLTTSHQLGGLNSPLRWWDSLGGVPGREFAPDILKAHLGGLYKTMPCIQPCVWYRLLRTSREFGTALSSPD